jgi:hypothetical protein
LAVSVAAMAETVSLMALSNCRRRQVWGIWKEAAIIFCILHAILHKILIIL